MIRWALKYIPRPWLIRMSALVRVLGPLLYVGSRFTDPIDGRSYQSSSHMATVDESVKTH